MMHTKAFRAIPTTILILLVAGFAALPAQDRADPVAMGKARASVASARGLSAIASNPGALDLPLTHFTTLPQDVSFSLYSFGGTIGSTYLSSSDFEQIFGRSSGWPNQEQRARLGEVLQDERLFANGANNLITLRWAAGDAGTFGLHYGHRAFARLNFPDDFTRVIARGELLAEQYRFIDRGVAAAWVTELGLSYGKQFGSRTASGWFPTIGLGATLKLLTGIAHLEVDPNSFIAVDQTTLNGTRAYVIQGGYVVRSALPEGLNPVDAVSTFMAGLFPPSAGTGFGADIGLSGVLYRRAPSTPLGKGRDAIYFGATIHDIGSVRWTDVAYERSQKGILDTINNGTLSNDQFKEYQGTLKRTEGYTTLMPRMVRAGLAMDIGAYAADLGGTMMVDIEGELPLDDQPGNADDPRVSIGVDWGVSNTVSLRGGLSGGGVSGFGIGLGVGLRPLEWLSVDIGTSELNGFFSGERVDLALRVAAGL